jgi:hypothetical protein
MTRDSGPVMTDRRAQMMLLPSRLPLLELEVEVALSYLNPQSGFAVIG